MGWFTDFAFNSDPLIDYDIEDDELNVYSVCLLIALTATCAGLGWRLYEAYSEDGDKTTVHTAPKAAGGSGGGSGGGGSQMQIAFDQQEFLNGVILTFMVATGNYCLYHVASGLLNLLQGGNLGLDPVSQDYFSVASDSNAVPDTSLGGAVDESVEASLAAAIPAGPSGENLAKVMAN